MTSTRNLVLKFMLNNRHSTINELAEAVDINPISVRHHITKLELAGLVDSAEERHGVGRPRRVYFLTEKGMEQFPQRYLSLSMRLVEQLKENLPEEVVGKLFEEMAAGIAEGYITEENWDEVSLQERVEIARRMLTSEGFTVEIEKIEDQYHIRETSCPYVHVGQEHPEVCIVDETMLETILAVNVDKTHCVLDGDPYCAYVTPTITQSDIQVLE